jgi:hypothetical protein
MRSLQTLEMVLSSEEEKKYANLRDVQNRSFQAPL